MKQVLLNLWQWVLRHRKKLIYWALAFFVFQFCFFNINWIWLEDQVYAEWTETETPTQSDSLKEKVTNWYTMTAFLRKVIYILLYPILIVAGKLIDNSFVYGEIFNFDAVLWQMWVMARNLADYALWFIFIFYIFKYLIDQGSKQWPKWIISRGLIAGVWIQASWFIMSALIDISTILTYGIWWLPMSVLDTAWDNNDKYNPYILKRLIDVDVKNIDDYKIFLTNTTGNSQLYIAPCKLFEFEWESLILAPSAIYYDYWTWVAVTENLMCHIDGNVYHFSELLVEKKSCNSVSTCQTEQNKYLDNFSNVVKELTQDKSVIQEWINAGTILQISPWISNFWNPNNGFWLDPTNKKIWDKTGRLSDLLEQNSYVWVFTSLYAALMSSWERVVPSDMWEFSNFLNVALSFCHMIAVAIPLFAAVVVFMMRIWVLRAAIILSPFIALLTAFDSKILKNNKNLSYFSLNGLIPIIFSPAIICFAVSLSTVLVNIIAGVDIETEGIMDKEILWWLIKLNIGWLSLWFWKLVVSVIWVAITWFLMWTAIKSSKLWELEIVQSIKKLATWAMWSMPIIPVVWKWADWKLTTNFVWTRAAFWWDWEKWILWKLADKKFETYRSNDNAAIDDLINPGNVQKKKDAGYKWVISSYVPTSGVNWTSQELEIKSENWSYKSSFASLSDSWKKDVIDTINGLSEDKRDAFWGNTPTVSVWDETYKYNNEKHKYELFKADSTK